MADSGLDLVTGGAGFIGSHVVEALLQAGRQVRVVDDLSTGHAKNLDGLEVDFVTGDLSEAEVAQAVCEGAQRVFHLAARPSVPWSFEEPELAYRANHGTTLSLTRAALRQGVKRIVFTSSSAVYGDSETLPKVETMSPNPLSPYAEHKWLGEQAMKDAAEKGLETVSLRYFNVYGPRQDPSSQYSGVISLFTRWASEGKTARVYGDGLQTRDFVFVGDVARANLLAAGSELPENGSVYNIARGERVTILQLWEMISTTINQIAVPAEHLPARRGDVRHSLADVHRAASDFGFEATVDLADGLRQTVAGV